MREENIGGVIVFQGPIAQQIPPTSKEIALRAIESMEQDQLLSRPVRDFMLATMQDKAKQLGLTEEQLIAKNTLYRRVKEFDDQIAELRGQL